MNYRIQGLWFVSYSLHGDSEWDVPITNMIDIHGNETNDPKAAVSIVARLPDGNWLAAECFPHEIVERPGGWVN